ncbi:MAG: hypothetical protein JW795_13840 [Chitinivibrionales bacterium]|nr:hypothetical protein [Chitinivibrionales bacterium]
MNKALKYLFDLQNVDFRILELQNSKQEFPKEAKKLEDGISKSYNSIQDMKSKLEMLLSEKEKLQGQLQDIQKNFDKSQERLNSIKTNKEYDAVHAELESSKHMVAANDKRVQKITQDIADLQTALNNEQNSFEKTTAENQPKIHELRVKISMIDSEIATIVTEREKILPEIPKHMLRTYEHIRSTRKNGKVVSVVSTADRNCTVCYQILQPQVINQIRKGIDLIYCQGCGSILVWQDHVL